jgi:hypothetical protein
MHVYLNCSHHCGRGKEPDRLNYISFTADNERTGSSHNGIDNSAVSSHQSWRPKSEMHVQWSESLQQNRRTLHVFRPIFTATDAIGECVQSQLLTRTIDNAKGNHSWQMHRAWLQFLEHHVGRSEAQSFLCAQLCWMSEYSGRILLHTADVAPISLILSTRMMEAIRSCETSILTHGIMSKKMAIITSIAVTTSNLT